MIDLKTQWANYCRSFQHRLQVTKKNKLFWCCRKKRKHFPCTHVECLARSSVVDGQVTLWHFTGTYYDDEQANMAWIELFYWRKWLIKSILTDSLILFYKRPRYSQKSILHIQYVSARIQLSCVESSQKVAHRQNRKYPKDIH